VLKVSAESFDSLAWRWEVNQGFLDNAGTSAMFGDECCTNVNEVRKCGIIAGQEIIKGGEEVKN
jgi:hypothetical protein